MRHAAPQIGLADIPRGILVSLPPRFWLVVSLRRSVRGVQAGAEPWTYLVPPVRGAGRRIEAWIAEVELQVRAEARRRAWTATDAEWSGAGTPQAPSPVAAPPAIVTLPRKRTARDVLKLLADLDAGAVLVVGVNEGVRGYRLAPSGRRVRTAAAERAIRERLIAPGNDGLFGPDWSQTWRAPTRSEIEAACKPARKRTKPSHEKPSRERLEKDTHR